MKYYPVGLNVTNKRCIVVGGGNVAERKVQRLLDCRANVCVIAGMLTPFLQEMVKEGKITHINSDYKEQHLEGAFLVIGATDQQDINEQISNDSRAKGILINIVDDPPECDFILPSVLERGDLVIAVLTGGKSPALARKLRMELEEYYGSEYDILLKIMGDLREKVLAKGRPPEENKKMFEAAINSDILKQIREKKWEEIKKFLKQTTGEDIEVGN